MSSMLLFTWFLRPSPTIILSRMAVMLSSSSLSTGIAAGIDRSSSVSVTEPLSFSRVVRLAATCGKVLLAAGGVAPSAGGKVRFLAAGGVSSGGKVHFAARGGVVRLAGGVVHLAACGGIVCLAGGLASLSMLLLLLL
jgi:hypothetical protein